MKRLLLLLLLLTLSFSSILAFNTKIVRHKDSTTDSTEVKPLKILSWNIYLLPAYIFETQTKYRRARGIAAELLNMDYDIIVFQEAFHYTARMVIARLLHDRYPYQYGPSNNKTSIKGSSGVWIISSIPLTNRHEIKYKTCKGTDALARKGAMLLEGCWYGITFQIVGTHLQSAGGNELRHNQMQQLHDELLIKFQKEGVPQFICGDMNTCYGDCEEYGNMLKILEADNDPYPEITGGTSTGGEVIDYILVRQNHYSRFNVKRNIKSISHPWSAKNHALSDHKAVEATILF
jgi:endonuclease/exonuclease/phosphatase family metal-dependent hydrolase